MRVGAEVPAAVFLGNDQAEEALGLQIVPDFLGQILVLVVDLPLIEHFTQFLDFVIQERLLVLGELGEIHLGKVIPVGLAAEQLRLEPGGAGLDGLALGVADRRHHLAERLIDRLADQLAAQAGVVEHHQRAGQQNQKNRVVQPGRQQTAQ